MGDDRITRMEIRKDITGIYPKLRRAVIDYMCSHESGLRGPVSNTTLRKWGWYKYKKAKIEGRM